PVDIGTRRARHRAAGQRRRWPHQGRLLVADRDGPLWRYARCAGRPPDRTPGRGDNRLERTASEARGTVDEPRSRAEGGGPVIPRRRAREAGFTLIELLIAVTLLALLTTLVFGTMKCAAQAWAKTDRRAVAAADLSAVQDLFRHAIIGA